MDIEINLEEFCKGGFIDADCEVWMDCTFKKDCPGGCKGLGSKPTQIGKDLLRFLERHYG